MEVQQINQDFKRPRRLSTYSIPMAFIQLKKEMREKKQAHIFIG
jgi:hypothetical protein